MNKVVGDVLLGTGVCLTSACLAVNGGLQETPITHTTSLASGGDVILLRARCVSCRYWASVVENRTRCASLPGATRVLLGYIRPGCFLVLRLPVYYELRDEQVSSGRILGQKKVH
jgi:hypothetical protein